MIELIGYKYLWVDLTSRFRELRHGGVQYKLNEWVAHKRNCGPLAVFKSKEMAIRYKDHCPGVIYKIKYIKSRYNEFWFTVGDWCGRDSNYPDGTEFATKVMLLKRCHI